ncbi:MAG: SH3 domain-containing protein [Cyanobacteria bacterium P01_H01_bin.105]
MSNPSYNVNGETIQNLTQGNNNNTIINNFHNSFQALSKGLKKIFSNILPKTTQESPNLVYLERSYAMQRESLDIEKYRLEYEITQAGRTYELQQKSILIQEQEFELKASYFRDKLELIRECHNTLVQLKLQEFELSWDLHHSPLILSPAKTRSYLQKDSDCLWILFSPVNLLCYNSSFDSLSTEIDNELEELVKSFYINGLSSSSIAYPIRYLQIFEKPIKKLTAEDIRDKLRPIPTLTIQSEVTDDRIFIYVTHPTSSEPVNGFNGNHQVTLPAWNWKSIKRNLESIGHNEEDSLIAVKELIILIHKVIVLYFSDFYLLGLYSYHTPKLFSFLDNSSSSSILNEWIRPFRTSLQDFQKYVQDKAAQELHENQNQQPLENELYEGSSSVIDFEDFQWVPIAIFCFLMMLSLGFCNQQSRRSFSEVVQPIDETLYKPEKYGTVQITNQNVNSIPNLWTEPNGSQQVGQLKKGDRLTVLAISNDERWYRVQSQDGQKGWIYGETVMLDP